MKIWKKSNVTMREGREATHGGQTLVSGERENEFVGGVEIGVPVFQSKERKEGLLLHGNGKGERTRVNYLLSIRF